MSTTGATLDQQLYTCKAIMTLFQQERLLLQNQGEVSLTTVREGLQRHMALVSSLVELCGMTPKLPASDDQKRKLGELSSLIQQLLVLQHENETELRQRLEQPSTARPKPDTRARRQRPALRPGLPFLPTDHDPVPATAPPRVARAAEIPAVTPPPPPRRPNPWANNLSRYTVRGGGAQ